MARQNNEDDYIDTIKQKLDEIAEQLNHNGKEEYITGKQLDAFIKVYAETAQQLSSINNSMKEISVDLKQIVSDFNDGFKKDIIDEIEKRVNYSSKVVVLSLMAIFGTLLTILGYVTHLIFNFRFDELLKKIIP